MATIEVSEKADWKLFENVARVLEQGLGGRWPKSSRWRWTAPGQKQPLAIDSFHTAAVSRRSISWNLTVQIGNARKKHAGISIRAQANDAAC